MADTLTALLQAILKKKQAQPVVNPDEGIDLEKPWESPVLTQPRTATPIPSPTPTPAATPAPATSPMITGTQAATIEEALALADKLKKQKAIAAALLPEQSWNR